MLRLSLSNPAAPTSGGVCLSLALAVLVISGVLISSCSDTGVSPNSEDTVAPDRVRNLSLYVTVQDTVYLQWTAPGGDNNHGRAASYDLRYASDLKTLLLWDDATVIDSIFPPDKPGSSEWLRLSGLNSNDTMYLALRTSDAAGNTSHLSNVICTQDSLLALEVPDSNLVNTIREIVPEDGHPLDFWQMVLVDTLVADSLDVSDITGLECLVRARYLSLDYNKIVDLSPLASLSQLITLDARGNDITDLTPVSGLSRLEKLTLSDNPVESLDGIENLTNLTLLDLRRCRVNDISALAGLTNLEYLNLSVGTDDEQGELVNVSVLGNLTNLSGLDLCNHQIQDISSMANLTNLRTLAITGNELVEIGPLASLTDLSYLRLTNNRIVDIQPLAGLSKLWLLYVAENEIVDISALGSLTRLTSLNIGANDIDDISVLAGLPGLQRLFMSDNSISDLSPLQELPHLIVITALSNDISDLGPLVAAAGLDDGDLLQVVDNPLSAVAINQQIPILQARGVDVLY